MKKIGITKEYKIPNDFRTPFTPEQSKKINASLAFNIVCEKSEIRCFKDREYLNNNKKKGVHDIINGALNSTLSRTINTSLTTFFVLLVIFIFGGEVIRGFMFALMVGVIIGTYSSIYVVANMLLSMNLTQEDLAVPEPEGADFDGMP